MNKLYLSASAIADFKACPMRYMLHYVEGLVLAEVKDSLRIGTNYHRLHEILGMKPGGKCECQNPHNIPTGATWIPNPICPLCDGKGKLPEDLMDAVIGELEYTYADNKCPASKELKDWQVEKHILLNTIAGYRWYWQHSQKVIQSEIAFNTYLVNPDTSEKLEHVVLKGKIDKIIELNNKVAEREYKSTSSDISSGSDYWKHLNLDTQTLLYIYIGQRLQYEGILKNIEERVLNTAYYDVWHKPQIKPKKLSQADTKKFFKTKEYFGVKFDIGGEFNQGNHLFVNINDVPAEMFLGKGEKSWSVAETPEMFGARYLADIAETPEKYFACKEIERSPDEIATFERELYNICQTIQLMRANNCWFKNEHQCEAKFKCPYVDICYNGLVKDIIAGETPSKYKRLFKKGK